MLAPLASRIISVCDAFDAMTHDRAYREAMSMADALSELEKNAPRQFDVGVVKALSQYVLSEEYGDATSRKGGLVISTKESGRIGRSVERMYEAVAGKNLDKLKGLAHDLRYQKNVDQRVKDLSVKLDDAVDRATMDDLDVVLDLINEIMQLCRDSRSKFVDAAESIVRSVHPSEPTDTALMDN